MKVPSLYPLQSLNLPIDMSNSIRIISLAVETAFVDLLNNCLQAALPEFAFRAGSLRKQSQTEPHTFSAEECLPYGARKTISFVISELCIPLDHRQ